MSFLEEELYDMYIDDLWDIDEGIWTQRDGTRIRVTDMTIQHIINTIRMLKRGNAFFKDEWIKVFTQELQRRF